MNGVDGRDTHIAGAEAIPTVSRCVAAEAAIWVTRLNGKPPTVRQLLRCLAWQARSPSHRYAYERTQTVWKAMGQLRQRY
ncbi:FecR/PupR family sigma factor regulator [Roseateles sp.]|uniref:FecR/PupR family sigma factor regulator n=1 Tax=Roseateles sp. TaxID=1971397 RepID=UPI002AA26C9C|nr:FecR/PupR family sigma factor regulator [Roseateles sp.]